MTLTPLLGLVVALVAAGSVVALVWGYYLARTEREVPGDLSLPGRRAQTRERGDGQRSPLSRMALVAGKPFASMILRRMGTNRTAKIRRRINAAGRPNGMTVEDYATRKGGFFVVFGGLGFIFFLMGSAFMAVVLLAAGLFWADLTLISHARTREYKIARSLPDFLDVLTVTVSAGLGFRQALERVCHSMPGPLAEEFRTALRQMELGTGRREAFEELRDRNSCEPLSQFVTALLQAEELGAPLSQALTEIGTDMRRESAQAARQKAARTTPRISLIMTTVMVPGVMILLAGTLFMAQRESFSGFLG